MYFCDTRGVHVYKSPNRMAPPKKGIIRARGKMKGIYITTYHEIINIRSYENVLRILYYYVNATLTSDYYSEKNQYLMLVTY